MANTLSFPADDAARLEPHLPPPSQTASSSSSSTSLSRPHVTLTFATSLDSALSLGPGIRTTLSGPQSKAMTHYLRSRHDAILIGVGTAIADDPGLNCRIDAPSRTVPTDDDTLASLHPRPIVIDPKLRWDFTRENKIFQLVRDGNGLAPFIITTTKNPPEEKSRILEEHGGKFIVLDQTPSRAANSWPAILAAIQKEGLLSVMIEGGGTVINSLLASASKSLIDSVIITIAPVWLGQGSVVVSPEQEVETGTGNRLPGPRLSGVQWIPLGEDIVLCGKLS